MPACINAAATANNSTTRAGIMMTAPAPISADARAAFCAFSLSSARANSNSLPISLANWPTASLNSSGIDRLVCKAIAIPLVDRLTTAALTAHGVAAHVSAVPCVRALAHLGCAAGSGRRTFQEAHEPEARQHRQAEESGRLAASEVLRATDEILELAILARVGNAFDLRSRLADIGPGNRQIIVELAGGAPHRVGKVADIFSADILLSVDG